ncbi:hypothetical protein GCM10023189_33620 [Nibrella saemangeumensis]|uniref:Uncharacterized protein n=1 Tax=Nibrella saemangeumensis TaxID=1084526 RepID=A0ABP8N1D8_9BACT
MNDLGLASHDYKAAYAFNQQYKVGDMVIVRTVHDHTFGGSLVRPAIVLHDQVIINLEAVPECFLLKQVLPKLK